MNLLTPNRLQSLAHRADAIFTPIAQVVTRIVFGQAFFLTGLGKLRNLPKIVEFFDSLGIPLADVQAPMVATIECVGGILLILGLGTRVTACLLTCTMVVALLTADRAKLFEGFAFSESFADVAPLPFLVGVLWLLAKGAGKLSLDHLVVPRLLRQKS
ncbi:MAG TPA: DoxX family protein [Planctomycetota bacterium]|nr:DoxX family protein [Planctomycetota bacterium]